MNQPPQQVSQSPGPRRKPSRGLLAPSFTLLRVRGIRIGAHWSWLVVFTLVSWSLGRDVFPLAYPGLNAGTYMAMAVVSALVFFICILLHELGHAFRAIKEGMKISGITLWLFGGVARFEGRFPSAGAEFRIAAAGPLVSIVLAGLFGLGAWGGGNSGLPLEIGGVLDYLARINIAVVVFNLIPALPLDGGRILRSWLWNRKNDFAAATVAATRISSVFAYFLMFIGVFWLFVGGPVNGLWSLVMGWFLLQASQAEKNYALVAGAFQDMSVRSLMTRNPVMFRSDTGLDEFLHLAHASPHAFYPVVDDGVLRGMVGLRTASAIPAEARSAQTVAAIMEQPVVLEGASQVVDIVNELRLPPGRAAVVEDGRVAGVLSLSDVARALEKRQNEAVPGKPKRRRWGVILGATAILLPIAATVYKPPIALVSPAPAVDVSKDVEIDGIPVTELSGTYILVAVTIQRPSALHAAFSYFNDEVDLVPLTRVLPAGVSETEYLQGQRRVFEESQKAAAAAAAEAVGLEVTLSGEGAEIVDVVEDSPADGKLRAGDLITSVDGAPIRLVSDLIAITTVRPVGTRFEMTVRRGSRDVIVPVTSARLEGFNSTNTGIGIISTTKDLEVDLPFEATFKNRNIGGPSAGLVYSLLIADLLDDKDVAQKRRIAASGTIQLDGTVGPVGGLHEKLVAAEKADADVFFVPRSELTDVNGPDRQNLVATVGIDDLSGALEILNGNG